MIAVLALAVLQSTPIIFVSSFNGVEGRECTLLVPPHCSTLDVVRLSARLHGSRLFLQTPVDALTIGASYTLYDGDRLIFGTVLAIPTIVFSEGITLPLTQFESAPTDAFRITTGTTFTGLKNPLSALIFTSETIFSARYDKIGTIFVDKNEKFDQDSPIFMLIYSSNGQKWLYYGKIDGDFLRFNKNRFPRGPL